MSLDLFIFERREEIKTSLDVLNYLEEFTKYEENIDYNSLKGCSPVITAWAKRMFEQFPPMNGEHASPDEIAFESEDSEHHLTDYALGKHGAVCSFSYAVDEEALDLLFDIADEYGIGVYDFQSVDNIIGKGIEILKYRTESTKVTSCTWKEVDKSINTLDDLERKTAFLTLWFDTDEADSTFIQCTPIYKEPGFFSRLLNKDTTTEINGYTLEVKDDNSVYQTVIQDKEQLKEIIKAWCLERELPDISKYKKVLDL